MNFQTVSTAQKLPVSEGLAGGYTANGTPGPLLSRALDYINDQVAMMRAGLARAGLTGSTTIVLSAKHGQSPIDGAALRRVDDGAIIDQLDAAWKTTHPSAAALVAFAVDDDGMLMWLTDHSAGALAFARQFLLTHNAPANTITDPKGTFSTTVAASGLTQVYTGKAADALVRAANGDTHTPDLIGIAQHGVVYTGGVAKIAEHGGAAADDRDVPLVVSGGGVSHGAVVGTPVQTTQIAPTILRLLGLEPNSLQAVRIDHTQVLPALDGSGR
jgi:hypothetical protein